MAERDDEETLETISRRRSGVIYAILFAALFVAGSWVAPVAYLQFAPIDHHVAIEDSNVTVTDEGSHRVGLTYDARARYPAEVRIRLFEERNGTDAEIQTWSSEGFLAAGENDASFTLELDEPPPVGVFYYKFDATIHVGYNVERRFSFTTEKFAIGPGDTNASNTTATPTPTATSVPDEETPTETEWTPTRTQPTADGTPENEQPIGD